MACVLLVIGTALLCIRSEQFFDVVSMRKPLSDVFIISKQWLDNCIHHKAPIYGK
jgi:hypothetical protein